MKVWLAALLAIVGFVLFVAGIAVIYPPAALIAAGALCVAVAFVVEVRDA